MYLCSFEYTIILPYIPYSSYSNINITNPHDWFTKCNPANIIIYYNIDLKDFDCMDFAEFDDPLQIPSFPYNTQPQGTLANLDAGQQSTDAAATRPDGPTLQT